MGVDPAKALSRNRIGGTCVPQIVIYSGIGLSVVPAITLLFYDDDKFLKEEEEEIAVAQDKDDAGARHASPCADGS